MEWKSQQWGLEPIKPQTTPIEAIISEAIRHGYRHLDTAAFYFNEEAVGKAVRESGIPREEFFLTSKVWKIIFGYDSNFAGVRKHL